MRSPTRLSVRGTRHCGEAGFSLMELMVSMGIMLVVLAGSFRAFEDARRASDAGALMADGNQNLRTGVVLMTRDAIQTGREMPSGGVPIPRGVGIVPIPRPAPPNVSLTFPATWATLPSICPGADLGPTINGVRTDILTVVYADAVLELNEYPLTSVLADGSRMTVDARTRIDDPATGLKPGDLIMFSNAVGNAIQTITSVSGRDAMFASGDAKDAFKFNQRTATSGSIMQIRSGGTFPTTSATRVTIVTYYVDDVTAPGQARLMRVEGFSTPRMVGVGIENLQVTFDIVDGTVNPANLPDAVAPYSPAQIRKVNLFLGRRSDQMSRQTGNYLRSSISTQVSLRSMSFRDRYR